MELNNQSLYLSFLSKNRIYTNEEVISNEEKLSTHSMLEQCHHLVEVTTLLTLDLCHYSAHLTSHFQENNLFKKSTIQY